MKKENFEIAKIEIFSLSENDIIVTSGIGLPDIPWEEEMFGEEW